MLESLLTAKKMIWMPSDISERARRTNREKRIREQTKLLSAVYAQAKNRKNMNWIEALHSAMLNAGHPVTLKQVERIWAHALELTEK